MYDRVQGWMYALEHHTIFAAVKKGFLLVIPIVLTGSFALLIRSFPIPAFQEWLAGFGGGFLLRLMNFIFDSTLDLCPCIWCWVSAITIPMNLRQVIRGSA